MPAIKHLFTINSSDRSLIRRTITDADQIAKWWTTASERQGDRYTFRFSDDYYKQFDLMEESENMILWKCIHGHPEWQGTTVRFEIRTGKEDHTDILFTHDQWADETDMYALCNFHWAKYMNSLKSLVEEGIGHPHKYPNS